MKAQLIIAPYWMKLQLGGIRRVLAVVMVSILATCLSRAGEPPPARVALEPDRGRCEDTVPGVAVIEPKLDAPLFHSTTTSYHWQIVEHEDGHLENTVGGQITAEDLLRIEHTADCSSTHQGKHAMEFCEAVATKDGVKLTIFGGMPAHASDLTVTIDHKLGFKCAFSAVHPGPSGQLHWKVKKKTLKLKSNKLEAGRRLHGWISVEFEEIDSATKVSSSHKIEGYIKPVIQTAVVEVDVPESDG